MSNTEIIYNAALAHGFTADQLAQLMIANKGDLPFHTFQDWKSRGFYVKKGEHALFDCELWRYTTKPSKAARDAAKEAGKDEPEDCGHYYKAKAYIFSFSQVQRPAKKDAAKKQPPSDDGPPVTGRNRCTGGHGKPTPDNINYDKITGGLHHERENCFEIQPLHRHLDKGTQEQQDPAPLPD